MTDLAKGAQPFDKEKDFQIEKLKRINLQLYTKLSAASKLLKVHIEKTTLI